MDRLAGMGSGIAITPVLEEGIGTTGLLEQPGKTLFVTGWTMTYETTQGTFTVSGKTIPEAVDAAFANREPGSKRVVFAPNPPKRVYAKRG